MLLEKIDSRLAGPEIQRHLWSVKYHVFVPISGSQVLLP